jgi:xanthine dehydrogenase accessory factor
MNELESILRAYEQGSRAGRVTALASVVGAWGSTYRRIGAHMLITEDGEVTGTISGGCLERDVRRHAMWVMQFGRPRRLVYDSTGDDHDAEDAYSLGCNGVVEVLIERLSPNDSYMALLANCVRASEPVVVVTILETGPGAATCDRLVWSPGKEPVTLGIEDDEQLRTLALSARSVFASGISTMRMIHTGSAPLAVCFEIIEPSPMLAIFGGGHDAIPVAALAKALGTKVTVVDPRPGQATRTRFPERRIEFCRAAG